MESVTEALRGCRVVGLAQSDTAGSREEFSRDGEDGPCALNGISRISGTGISVT